MDENNLQAAHEEFWADLLLEAEASGEPLYSVFFQKYAKLASENGDCSDLSYTPACKEGRSGYQIDGYALDLERGELYLAICDFRQESVLQTLNAVHVDGLIRKACNFCQGALQASFIRELEEASPAFEAGYPIYANGNRIKRIRVIAFSNAKLSTRRKPELAGDVSGIPIVCNLFDFSRFFDIQQSRNGSESIEIDVVDLNGSPLPCLQAHGGTNDYESYLVAMPGDLLAKIYGLYGARLLEQNVRTFLQARTKVNAGIIQTISNSPQMFFAYNNGLTVTASELKTVTLNDGALGIATIRDLQIVNGGQTTASILYAKDQTKADLTSVYVQMKLSVVRPDLMEEIVPKISRFANTQNRISEADFSSSDAFHLMMEKISRRISAPPRPGFLSGSKWFYERARGQYKDGRAYGTTASRKKFELEFPKEQVIDKTDFAKYEMTYQCKPNVVSGGAQKCFLEFSEKINEEWSVNELSFNDDYFRRAIAKAILFRQVDQMIGKSTWYQNDRGYKAQIVTYTISWVLSFIRAQSKELNLHLIWNSQDISESLRYTFNSVAPKVAQTIKNAPPHIRNIGEYSKQQSCWTAVSASNYPMDFSIGDITIDADEARRGEKDAGKIRKIDRDIEFDMNLVKIASDVERIMLFAKTKGLLSPKSEAALLKLSASAFAISTSERNVLKHLFSRLSELGFEFPR